MTLRDVPARRAGARRGRRRRPGRLAGRLDANKQAYAEQFVARAGLHVALPARSTAAEYVDALYATAGVTPTQRRPRRPSSAFGAGGTAGRAGGAAGRWPSRSRLTGAEFNPAFVLMQYFGYLRGPATRDRRRGYNFWLAKLNQFNGDFVRAEMVKAFIASTEYRRALRPAVTRAADSRRSRRPCNADSVKSGRLR